MKSLWPLTKQPREHELKLSVKLHYQDVKEHPEGLNDSLGPAGVAQEPPQLQLIAAKLRPIGQWREAGPHGRYVDQMGTALRNELMCIPERGILTKG